VVLVTGRSASPATIERRIYARGADVRADERRLGLDTCLPIAGELYPRIDG
jgi:hypothetical protein